MSSYFSKEYFSKRLGNDSKRLKSFRQEKEIINKFINSGNLLDVGCSTGEFIKNINWNGPTYGMEISEYAIKQSKLNGIKFEKNLFNVEEYFDIIIFRGTVQHLDIPFYYIKKTFDALKPGGYLVFFATPNSNSLFYKLFNTLPFLVPKVNYYIPSDICLTNVCVNYGFQLLFKRFPYLKSPYRSIIKDHFLFLLKLFKFPIKTRFSFWRNSMDLVFKKPQDK